MGNDFQFLSIKESWRSNILSKIFNNLDGGQICSQKDFEMFPDFKLSFNQHLETVLAKVNRGIVILCKLQFMLPREAFFNYL